MQDTFSVKGNLKIVLTDANGDVKDTRELKNLVVTAGKSHIASRMASNTAVIMSHLAVGTTNTTATVGQTTLVAEIDRVPLDSSSVSGATVQYQATLPAGNATGSLKEAGIFNASSNGTMLCRTVFSPLVKASDDTVVIVWDVTVQ